MIPLRLQLKNFLSYGSKIQTIDFSPYPLICLSGKNGHGKSALLDAITWALWGQARKVSATSRADAGLVRLGQTQMMVTLDFECNGERYRVKREYMITYGKPLSILEFGIYQEDIIVPLTDKTIRKTQEKIEQILHLNFDSFTNSAFLRQGQSNEFSKKSPKDRKEILARILGLNKYEDVRKLALEKVKDASTKQQVLQALQEKYRLELDTKKALLKEQDAVIQQLEAIKKQELDIDRKQKNIDHKQNQLSKDQEQHTRLLFILEQLNSTKQELENELKEIYKSWKNIHAKQLESSYYEKITEQKKTLAQQHALQQEKLDRYLVIKERYLRQQDRLHALKQTVAQKYHNSSIEHKIKRERCNAELNNLKNQIRDLNQQKDHLKRELSSQQEAIATLQASLKYDHTTTFNKMMGQFDQSKEQYHLLNAKYSSISNELRTLQQKKGFISNIENPSCPLCEQNLSASRKRFLHTKFDATEHTTMQKLSFLKSDLLSLKNKLNNDHSLITEQKTLVEKQKAQELVCLEASKKQKQIETALEQLNEHINMKQQSLSQHTAISNNFKNQAQQSLDQAIKTNSEIQKAEEQLALISSDLKKYDYDAKQHQEIKNQLEELEQNLNEYDHIKQEYQLQEQRKKNINLLCNKLRRIKQELHAIQAQLMHYSNLNQSQQYLDQEKKSITNQYKTIQSTRNQLLQEKGKLTNKCESLQHSEQEYEKQNQQVKELEKIKKDYQMISMAAGKDGIQALLIEQVIPEIEQEANEILAQLSDNQTHIMIESLRDLKKGGTKETLDIKISDMHGIRAYELFSGGEAFRIDFALRIAISKFLARRAGTTLQTLIIDEGFGSQDEEGLSNIMDTIYKIQNNFTKIIIVSHLATMKNQFPVHFIINKKPEGSLVQINEQG